MQRRENIEDGTGGGFGIMYRNDRTTKASALPNDFYMAYHLGDGAPGIFHKGTDS